MVVISEFLYLVRQGPKTVVVIGPETWSAVTWCRYCIIQFIFVKSKSRYLIILAIRSQWESQDLLTF